MGVREGNKKGIQEDSWEDTEIEVRGMNADGLQAEEWELDAVSTIDEEGEECNCVSFGDDDD